MIELPCITPYDTMVTSDSCNFGHSENYENILAFSKKWYTKLCNLVLIHSWEMSNISIFFKAKMLLRIKIFINLPPKIKTITEKVFSATVFGAMFPNPTVVKLVKIKYKALMYSSEYDGPSVVTLFEYEYGFLTWTPGLSGTEKW